MNKKIGLNLLFFAVLALLLSLSVWQWHRAGEKREFLKQQEHALQQETLQLSNIVEHNAEVLRYRTVKVTGHYDGSQQFLVDNQVSNGKVGFFVLTPFILQGSTKAVLVNRGWIAANQDRNVLPDVDLKIHDTITITGRVNHFPPVGIKLNGAEIPTETKPSVVQVVDSAVLAHKLGYELFDFQLELNADEANGFKRDWHTATIMPPEQHIAYSLQWLGLAITWIVLFSVFRFKKIL